MSKKTEKRQWENFKRKLPAGTHAVRIENYAGTGTPDTNIKTPRGRDSWVELKVASHTGRVEIRPEQIPWLYKRCEAGGRGYFMVHWKGTNYLLDGRLEQMPMERVGRNTIMWMTDLEETGFACLVAEGDEAILKELSRA